MAETTKAGTNVQEKKDNLFYRFIRQKESAIFLALIGIMLIITIIAPKFATPETFIEWPARFHLSL